MHSSLIDELTERHPLPKPELGIPMRHSHWQVPALASGTVVVCEVELSGAKGGSKGLAFLTLEDSCAKKLKIDAKGLWDSLLRRAGGEFMHRGIKPLLDAPVELKPGDPLPAHFHQPTRVVWIPMKIDGSSCFLGMGV